MKSHEALECLEALLQDAGVDPGQPSADDVETTWRVMRQFAAERVEDCEPPEQDGDGLLAQYGVHDWGAGEHFELDMTRQFSFVDDDGEYDHMAQLSCTFLFPATPELAAIDSENEWSFGMPLDVFFERALALPGFTHVRESATQPLELRLSLQRRLNRESPGQPGSRFDDARHLGDRPRDVGVGVPARERVDRVTGCSTNRASREA